MRTRTNKIPVYLNGNKRFNRQGEAVKDKISRLKRELGPIEIISHTIMSFGKEVIIPEEDIEIYRELNIEVKEKIVLKNR